MSKSRGGNYRDRMFSRYEEKCFKCGFIPSRGMRHLLHIHHKTPVSDGGGDELDNLMILCEDCHIDEHSDTDFSVTDIRKISNTFCDNISHKKNGYSERLIQRVKIDSIYEYSDVYIVEGLMDGDEYDSYEVDFDSDYLDMCDCYSHSYGSVRAVNLCSHVGSCVVWKLYNAYRECMDMEIILKNAKKHGKRLDKRASKYVKKKDKIDSSIDRLKEESGYKDSHFRKGKAQALRMTRQGNKWVCFGGECESAIVTVGSQGYTCSIHGSDYPPCSGTMGAYILKKING